jgi:hypothetical protein
MLKFEVTLVHAHDIHVYILAAAAGQGRSDLAPLRILRDFEARTFGPPASLHNVLPLALPASAASSPRTLPQSPLGASNLSSAAALHSRRYAISRDLCIQVPVPGSVCVS